jgi:hypothetical protein
MGKMSAYPNSPNKQHDWLPYDFSTTNAASGYEFCRWCSKIRQVIFTGEATSTEGAVTVVWTRDIDNGGTAG